MTKKKSQNWSKGYWVNGPGVDVVRDLARHKYSKKRIADEIGITLGQFERWCDESPELNLAANTHPRLIDALVEDALYKRAVGYKATEDTYRREDGDLVLVSRTVKDVPGDVNAQKFWLSNRRYEDWRINQPELPGENEYLEDVKRVLVTIEDVASSNTTPEQGE